MRRWRLARDEDGATLVEFSIMGSFFFVFVLGAIDFLLAFTHWNIVVKAGERAARLAAVSAPVSAGISTTTGIGGSVTAGDPMPAFAAITCSGATASCSSGGYVASAMSDLVYGPQSTACNDATRYFEGMCDGYDRITPSHVTITYSDAGLGFAGRPGGPVPIITLTLSNVPIELFLLGWVGLVFPPITVSVTAEDMRDGP